MNKKTIFIIAMLSAAVMFAAGWYSGQYYYSKLFATSELSKSTAELAGLQLKIEQLDSKKYESVKTDINVDIDGKILLINSLLSDSSCKNDIVIAKKFLSRVAKHRKQFPVSYQPNITDKKYDDYHKSIQTILSQYSDYRP